MSFRKRNVPIVDSRSSQSLGQAARANPKPSLRLPGTRPSTIDGRLVTSTGTATLDNLLAGHGGLCLGTSLLIEESGTTDYSGALLRFFAAEGLLQGHHVHVVALPESWGRELPGPTTDVKERAKHTTQESEKIKIAWRYEKLGHQDAVSRERSWPALTGNIESPDGPGIPFNHTFDLTKRLDRSSDSKLNFLKLDQNRFKNPFAPILSSLAMALASSPPSTVHRLVLPNLLSPAFYPPQANSPAYLFQTIHSLRALLSSNPTRLSVFATLPISLHPRTKGLTRWLEILSDGVLELVPFPHSSDAEFAVSRDPNTKEEPPQGMLRIHKLPILHEMGCGLSLSDMDWTFTMSRRRFTIKPFNLPPIEGDTDAQHAIGSDNGGDKAKKADMEF